MSWCCVKGKPKDQTDIKQLQRPSIRSGNIPKSTVMFSAESHQPQTFTNQNQFVSTKNVNAYAQSNLDRDSHYYEEAVNAKQSKLIKPKEIHNYDLDGADGVSKVPVVNTFHYQTLLNHFFVGYPQNNRQTRGSARQEDIVTYQYNSSPDQYMASNQRNTINSQLQEGRPSMKLN